MKTLKRCLCLCAASLLLSGAVAVQASEHEHKRTPPPQSQMWKTECGSCHVAYPPRLLTAAAWHTMMAGLDKHFGVNASMDAASAKEVSTFLESNAGKGKYGVADKPTLRITETNWFIREHREVSTATWKHPKVKSAANCGACHTGAAEGDYDEDSIRIPR